MPASAHGHDFSVPPTHTHTPPHVLMSIQNLEPLLPPAGSVGLEQSGHLLSHTTQSFPQIILSQERYE